MLDVLDVLDVFDVLDVLDVFDVFDIVIRPPPDGPTDPYNQPFRRKYHTSPSEMTIITAQTAG